MHSSKKILGLVFFVIFSVAILPFFAPFQPSASSLTETLQIPSLQHFLGTDSNGRDIFSQILYGARLSLGLSLVVVFNCVFLGTLAGFTAGYFSGISDRIFLFLADIFQAFPGILLAIAVAAFIPPSIFNLILLLSFVGWVSYARVVRAQVLELKTREFIVAGRALGVPLPQLLWRHFLPNMAGPLIVQASFGMAGIILAESTLSFLGLGLPLHLSSLGRLLDSGVNLLLVAPYVSLFPGFVIMLFVLLFNLVGEKLRDRLV